MYTRGLVSVSTIKKNLTLRAGLQGFLMAQSEKKGSEGRISPEDEDSMLILKNFSEQN
jgi:hypothetical protein